MPPWSALEINALQRASTLVLQKSIKEGFGLTVTEALWKSKPTIAAAVGGIPTQVIHKLTGVLVYSVEGCAYQIRYLLTHPEFAKQLGEIMVAVVAPSGPVPRAAFDRRNLGNRFAKRHLSFVIVIGGNV